MNDKLFGKNLILYGVKNGVFVPVSASKTCSINITSEVNAATPTPNSVWASTYYGQLSYKIAATGICVISDTKLTHRDAMAMQIARQKMLWACKSKQNDNEFYWGYVVINEFDIEADLGDMQLYTLSGTGDGALNTDNPYQTILLQADDGEVLQDGNGSAIGYIDTGGLPPINDNC